MIYSSICKDILLFQLKVINFHCDFKLINYYTLIRGIKYRYININNKLTLHNGITELLKTNISKLKSSQEASLNFGIPNYSIFLLQLEFFIQEFILKESFNDAYVKILKKTMKLLKNYRLFLAELLFNIQNQYDFEILKSFEGIILFESKLNRMFKLHMLILLDINHF